MKNMLEMGSLEYSAKLNLLLMDENSIEEIVKEKGGNIKEVEGISPLQYLLKSAELSDMFLLELQNAFSTFI